MNAEDFIRQFLDADKYVNYHIVLGQGDYGDQCRICEGDRHYGSCIEHEITCPIIQAHQYFSWLLPIGHAIKGEYVFVDTEKREVWGAYVKEYRKIKNLLGY